MNVVNYKNIKNIEYPAFLLPNDNIYSIDGLMYIDDRLLDDRNMPGRTIGQRRLQSPMDNFFRLNRYVDSIQGIIKQNKRYFIDNLGRPFIYEKTKFCRLKYHKIKRVERKDTASVVYLKGVPTPFTVPRPPDPSMLYAGILYLNLTPWVLYEFSEEYKKETRKKV